MNPIDPSPFNLEASLVLRLTAYMLAHKLSSDADLPDLETLEAWEASVTSAPLAPRASDTPRFLAQDEPQYPDVLSRIWDHEHGQYCCRMMDRYQAESAVWAWNLLLAGKTLVAVDSPLQVVPPVYPGSPRHDFYEGAKPRGL